MRLIDADDPVVTASFVVPVHGLLLIVDMLNDPVLPLSPTRQRKCYSANDCRYAHAPRMVKNTNNTPSYNITWLISKVKQNIY